ncbi:MAG: tetratricopeptide repeat protein, partial [Planctomycetia bacterium]|nr:tetratricopeptide repeat protein [Planctomycetia bacterium]
MKLHHNRLFSASLFFLSGLLLVSDSNVVPVFAQDVATEAETETVDIPALQAAAEKGDAEAQLYLGMRYSMGEGVPQDDRQALKWLQMAAKQKNYQAQYILSIYCMEGRAVAKNEEMGLRLLQSAATGGFAEAQYEYATYLSENEKVEEAIPWMEKAVAQGYVPAQTALGLYYVSTAKQGTPEMEKGMTYLTLSATEGDLDAQTTLGATFLELGDNVAGIVWLEVAGMNGDKEVATSVKGVEAKPEEYFEVATIFLTGDGIIPKSYDKCKFWAEKAAAENHAGAQFLLGTYYTSGINHELDLVKGAEFLQKSAAQGHAEAQFMLALSYRNGRGVTADTKKSLQYLQLAAKQN